MKQKLAYFISPHGFGHAARSAAVMESLSNLNKNIEFEIFTTVPQWFFANSGIDKFNYHELLTDIGLVQKSALQEDLDETIVKLDEFIPFDESLINQISKKLAELNCRLVLSDISPLGLKAAASVNISSVLIENFTWDWIYSQYKKDDARLNKHIAYLNKIYGNADYRIKTRPICSDSVSDLNTNPVSRKPKSDRVSMRKRLEVPVENRVVMITMGGGGAGGAVPSQYGFIDKLKMYKDITFIIPGSSNTFERTNNLILLPYRSDFFHPDLINISDAVIGKVGYSTLAEVYNAGVPFGYVGRPQFPESDSMCNFISTKMKGIEISENDFYSGRWLSNINKLLSLPKVNRIEENGAEKAAEFINNLI